RHSRPARGLLSEEPWYRPVAGTEDPDLRLCRRDPRGSPLSCRAVGPGISGERPARGECRGMTATARVTGITGTAPPFQAERARDDFPGLAARNRGPPLGFRHKARTRPPPPR